MTHCSNNRETAIERAEVLAECRQLFERKLHDYGPAWRIMRASSLTDQIYIKANRIRTLQKVKASRVDEGIDPEFVGIINYGIIAMIQLERGEVETPDIPIDRALELYDLYVERTMALMDAKNHDYGEVWRQMRISSIVDLILSKIHRTKQIEDLEGHTLVSEGIEANYMDMVNYAIFALIKLRNEA